MPGVLLGLVIGTFILFVLDRGKGVSAALTARRYLVEMLSILPPHPCASRPFRILGA